MKTHNIRAEAVQSRIQELATYSDEKEHLSRIFGTKAFMHARDKIAAWMQEAGLKTYVDNIGNVRGKLISKKSDAKTFVIGSHYDTVINAGKYDGPLGILAGLNIIEKLIKDKAEIPFNIELVAFSDEEGVRFHSSFLGSKMLTGNFDINLLSKKDNYGISLEDVLQNLQYSSTKFASDAIAPKKWLGYYEIHIEQGPVLYKKDIAAGIVTGIAGQKRITIEFTGVAGHAGTVPMNMRTDALCAASEFVVAVEHFASSKKNKVIATVGKLDVQHAASNVIAGKVSCSLDLRGINKKKLAKAYEDINELCEVICDKRKVYFEWKLVQETNPVACDEQLNKYLKKAIKDINIEVIELESGAGHDGVIISEVAPFTMLFVKCFKGISHNPLEKVDTKDIAAALEISDSFMEKLIQSSKITD